MISYLNNESVAWVRSQDSHILAVDSEVFISDDRFNAHIQKLSNLWLLKVNIKQTFDKKFCHNCFTESNFETKLICNTAKV